MAYSKTNWQDLPDTSTPVNASNLNKIENQLETNTSDIEGILNVMNFLEYTSSLTSNANKKDFAQEIFDRISTGDPYLGVSIIPNWNRFIFLARKSSATSGYGMILGPAAPCSGMYYFRIINGTLTIINVDKKYTSTEEPIGYWTNSKPIYRKVFTGTTNTSGAFTTVVNSSSFADREVISFNGYVLKTGSGARYPISSFTSSSGDYVFPYQSSNHQIQLYVSDYSTNTYDYTLTVDYIKTTD